MRKILVVGETLFDMLPDGKKIGGAPFNFSFHLTQLQNNLIFVSRIGNDWHGNEALDIIAQWNMDAQYIQIDQNIGTGAVDVEFDNLGEPTFHIIDNRAFDYIQTPSVNDIGYNNGLKLFYFGTLAQRNPVSETTIFNIIRNLPTSCTVLLDLNLRAPFYTKTNIAKSLEHTDILKINKNELQCLMDEFSPEVSDKDLFIRNLMTEYKIGWICITMGLKGCYAYKQNRMTPYFQASIPAKPYFNSMGAGDAFSAMLAHGFVRDWEEKKILMHAARFSSDACKVYGALPESKEHYMPYLDALDA